MRQFKALLSLLLVCILILPCCIARGETCYALLRDLLSSRDTEWYIGEGIRKPADVTNGVLAAYVIDKNVLFLYGLNDSGEGESTTWTDPDSHQLFSVLYHICDHWDVFQTLPEEGNDFALMFIESQDPTPRRVIYTSEGAAEYVKFMDDTLNSGGKNQAEDHKTGE